MGTVHQTDFLQALGWAVLNSLWQMALLWILYQLIFSIYKSARPGVKASAASILLFAGFGWFLLTLFSIWYTPASSVYGISGLLSPDTVQQSWLINALPAGSVVYLVLLVFPVLNFIRNYRYVRLIRTSGLTKADVQWRIFTKNVAARMGITQPVKIWLSSLVSSPVTIGYFKPIILLPVAAVNQLTPAQTEAILLHELAHIRRYDFLVNLWCRIIRTILYFNPFVRAFSAILEREREQHCDEMVVQFQYDRHSYASALLILEKAAHSRQGLTLAAAQGNKNELLHRIEHIMGMGRKQRFSLHKAGGIVAALLLLLSANALVFISKPEEEKNSSVLADLYSPLYFADNTSAYPEARAIASAPVETNAGTIVNHLNTDETIAAGKPIDIKGLTEAAVAEENLALKGMPDPSLLQYVAANELAAQNLTTEESAQVKEALNLSKRVLEEIQWKSVEADIADALNSLEKAEVKEVYKEKALEADWDKMETKLRAAYDQINWEEVNKQLDHAMNAIKLDSLQQVYTVALNSLNKIQHSMKQAKQKSIPDSDITTQTLELKKKEIENALKKLSVIRNRKTIKI